MGFDGYVLSALGQLYQLSEIANRSFYTAHSGSKLIMDGLVQNA